MIKPEIQAHIRISIKSPDLLIESLARFHVIYLVVADKIKHINKEESREGSTA